MAKLSTFEEFRQVTGWVRPPHDHSCKPVEVIPGLWTAHYHDIESPEKLKAATPENIRLIINTATCQCEARTGFFGDGVEVLAIDLEDDPDERKKFDSGKTVTSKCKDPDVPLHKRFAGDAKRHFDPVNDAIDKTIAEGGAALVHCYASLSRSAAFVLAYIMRTKGLSLVEAAVLAKSKWDATWPCDRFVDQLLQYERQLRAPLPPVKTGVKLSTFEEARQLTGWVRPPHDHGCKPVEVIPGLWTAHYHDIESPEKLKAAAPENIRLIINTATCQCEARTGFFGDGVEVLAIDLEDDPDEKKKFDSGKEATSSCTNPDVRLHKRFAGDAKRHFDPVNDAIDKTIAEGGVALVHCYASLSRSAAFVLAYIMRTKGLSLLEAIALMKPKWDATWPCDRFIDQLLEYEHELATRH